MTNSLFVLLRLLWGKQWKSGADFLSASGTPLEAQVSPSFGPCTTCIHDEELPINAFSYFSFTSPISHFSFLISHFSFLISHFSFLIFHFPFFLNTSFIFIERNKFFLKSALQLLLLENHPLKFSIYYYLLNKNKCSTISPSIPTLGGSISYCELTWSNLGVSF